MEGGGGGGCNTISIIVFFAVQDSETDNDEGNQVVIRGNAGKDNVRTPFEQTNKGGMITVVRIPNGRCINVLGWLPWEGPSLHWDLVQARQDVDCRADLLLVAEPALHGLAILHPLLVVLVPFAADQDDVFVVRNAQCTADGIVAVFDHVSLVPVLQPSEGQVGGRYSRR